MAMIVFVVVALGSLATVFVRTSVALPAAAVIIARVVFPMLNRLIIVLSALDSIALVAIPSVVRVVDRGVLPVATVAATFVLLLIVVPVLVFVLSPPLECVTCFLQLIQKPTIDCDLIPRPVPLADPNRRIGRVYTALRLECLHGYQC